MVNLYQLARRLQIAFGFDTLLHAQSQSFAYLVGFANKMFSYAACRAMKRVSSSYLRA